jgi:hypothetical protein
MHVGGFAQFCHVIELVRLSRGGRHAPARERPSVDNGLHRREQLASRVRFHDEAASAGCNRGIDDLAGLMRAEKQDSRGGILGQYALGGGDAVERGEAHVQQNEVGPQRPRLLHSARAVCRFGHEEPSTVRLDGGTDPATPRFGVIDYQNSVHRPACLLRRSSVKAEKACNAPYDTMRRTRRIRGDGRQRQLVRYVVAPAPGSCVLEGAIERQNRESHQQVFENCRLSCRIAVTR